MLQRDDQGEFQELAIFQGASFFRSLAPGQNLGVTARGLSIRTGDSRGEEFPIFRAVWIEKATRAANALTINALLDSESVAGAYRFTLHPGDATIIDVECSLFPRAALDNYGLATMSATSLFSPLDRRGDDDVREAAAELTGLQMLTGAGEWVWRPVSNRNNLQISEFIDTNPKGFGFLQRNREFDDFYDLTQHWERRPSLWIEPIGDWGPGSVELVEIPVGQRERPEHDRVLALENAARQGPAGRFRLSPVLVLVAAVAARRSPRPQRSRGGRGAAAKQRRFLVEFRGDTLADRRARSPTSRPIFPFSRAKSPPCAPIPRRERKSCYVQFDIDVGNENACEMRLTLEAQGAPLSETWLYRWTQ